MARCPVQGGAQPRGIGDQDRGVAGVARAVADLETVPGLRPHRRQYLANRGPAAGAAVEHPAGRAVIEPAQRGDMDGGEIGDVDVIAHTGPVRRRVPAQRLVDCC